MTAEAPAMANDLKTFGSAISFAKAEIKANNDVSRGRGQP
jgi:hypothetical protein